MLGLFDTELRPWVYPALTALFLVTCLSPLSLPRAERLWVAAVVGCVVAAYSFTVFFIFYLVWTPADAEQIWGVQGRYFLPVLPAVAIVIAGLIPRGLSPSLLAAVAVGAALLSGGAAVEGILRFDWELF